MRLPKRGRPLKTVEGLALRVHRILRDGGPRNLNVLRGYCEIGAGELGVRKQEKKDQMFERIVGILFLRGIVEWESSGRHRRLAARTEA